MLEKELKSRIAEVPDFPKPGISFKDITPVLHDPELSRRVTWAIAEFGRELQIDCLAGIDARGFLFGMAAAQELGVPFLPIRKQGKLPRSTYQVDYELEYGSASLCIHQDDLQAGNRVLIHDDLLATGGSAAAAAELIGQAGAEVVGLHFLIELSFLKGRTKLPKVPIERLCAY